MFTPDQARRNASSGAVRRWQLARGGARHTAQRVPLQLADFGAALGLDHADIGIGQIVGDPHLGRASGLGPVLIVVVEDFGQPDRLAV